MYRIGINNLKRRPGPRAGCTLPEVGNLGQGVSTSENFRTLAAASQSCRLLPGLRFF